MSQTKLVDEVSSVLDAIEGDLDLKAARDALDRAVRASLLPEQRDALLPPDVVRRICAFLSAADVTSECVITWHPRRRLVTSCGGRNVHGPA